MGMLQRVALPCCTQSTELWFPHPFTDSPECPCLALTQPLTPQRPCRKVQDSGATWSLCWHSCGLAASVQPERCSDNHTSMWDPSWDAPHSHWDCCKFEQCPKYIYSWLSQWHKEQLLLMGIEWGRLQWLKNRAWRAAWSPSPLLKHSGSLGSSVHAENS